MPPAKPKLPPYTILFLMEVTQADFVFALLSAVQIALPEATVHTIEKLLRHLAIEWAGDTERRTLVEGLLGAAAGQTTPRQRLASEMARAIQAVCRWWP